MDILSILRLLWRQRIVVGVMCGLSVLLIALVFFQTPPKYTATSAVVLFNPPKAPDDQKVPTPGSEQARRIDNPYVRFNDTSVVVDVLRRILVSDGVAERLRAKGVTQPYAVAANLDFYRGPIIDVSTEGASQEAAISANKLVVEELEATLVEMQASQGTDPVYSFTADEVVSPSKAKRVITSTIRRMIGAGALCAFLVLGSAVAADVYSARRRRPKGGSGQAGGAEGPDGLLTSAASVSGSSRLSLIGAVQSNGAS